MEVPRSTAGMKVFSQRRFTKEQSVPDMIALSGDLIDSALVRYGVACHRMPVVETKCVLVRRLLRRFGHVADRSMLKDGCWLL